MEAGTAFLAAAIAWLLATHTAFVERITQIVNDIYTFLMNLPAYCMETGMAFLSAAAAWLIAAYTTVITWITNTVNEAYTYLMNLPTYCTEAGASFVAAADAWASDAYDAVMNWISKIPDAVSNTLSGAWDTLKSGFSGGVTAGISVAANARGGIYQKGAFLTTFAEDSPEAAIPIDGSARAASLWKQTGEMMGLLPKETAEIMPQATAIQESTVQARPPMLTLVPPITQTIQNAAPQLEASVPIMQMQAPTSMQSPTAMAMPPSGGVNITFNPTIHIDGAVDAGIVEQLRVELERQKQELIAMFPTLLRGQKAHERRLSYA